MIQYSAIFKTRPSKEEKALVETYRSLSREQRELISQTIRLMGEQNNRREG